MSSRIMYNRCCVVNCNSKRKEVQYHRFPKNVTVLRKWVECLEDERLRSLSYTDLRKMFVCRKHFEKRFFTFTHARHRTTLDAYPTLFTATEIASGKPETVLVKPFTQISREHDYTIKRQHSDHTYCKTEFWKPFETGSEKNVHMPASHHDTFNESSPSHSEPTEIPEPNEINVQMPADQSHYDESLDISSPSHSEPTMIPAYDIIVQIPAAHRVESHNVSRPSHSEPANIPAYEIIVQKRASHYDKSFVQRASHHDKRFVSSSSHSEPTEISEAKDNVNIGSKTSPFIIINNNNVKIRSKISNPTRNSRQVLCTPRCAMLREICKKSKRQIKYYRKAKKVAFLKSFEKLTKKMNPLAKKFIWMQIKQNKKKTRGRRFSDEEKFIALTIMQLSRNCYRFLHSIFSLPSLKTLNKMLANSKDETGVNSQIEA